MAKKSNKPSQKNRTKRLTATRVKVIGFKSISANKTNPKKKAAKRKR